MASKDIFNEPFDEGTLAKLEIFEKYFENWLPTFIMSSSNNKPIRVFDLFGGSGYDFNRVPGSPIRTLQIIDKHRVNLIKKNKKVFLYFNDLDKKKIDTLKNNIQEKIKELSLKSIVEVNFYNEPFKECLSKFENELKTGCNLIFIDQNGFKEVDEQVFQSLITLDTTDFIFFISSSYIYRFANVKEVRKYHPKFDFDKIKNTHRKQIHNVICEEFHKYIPPNISSNIYILPFSIIKSDNNNVYGIIFVTKHIRGADKFLNVVWKKNPINGNANFDIDDDLTKNQLDLFQGKIPTKIEKFKYDLKNKILNGEIKNNKEAYIYTITQGHIPKHSDEEIRKMKSERSIKYNSKTPLVNYNQAFKNSRIIEYKVLKHENYKNRMD